MMHADFLTLARGILKGRSRRFKVVIEEITITAPFRSLFSMSTTKLKTTESETKQCASKDGTTSPLLTTPEPATSKRITRNAHHDAVLSDKEKFLNMKKEEKRKLYKCGKKFKQLNDIPTWPDFYNEHKERMKKAAAKKKLDMRYNVNEDINQRVSIWKGDITTLEIDAIVNAANSSLLGGGGVDGAIHSAAGKKLVAECATLNGCDTGDAKITAGYKLPARYVIHTVGPIGEKEDLLSRAYSSVLSRVKENSLASVAIPCISTGIYGYPSEKAVHVALQTVRDFLENDEYNQNIARVIFCLFMPKDVALYEEQMQAYFPVAESACTDHKRDIKMDNSEAKKVNEKKKDHEKEEKMDTEGENKKVDASVEEKMETEGKEEEIRDDTELMKNTKDKTPRHIEEKMNISEDNKSTSDKSPRHTEEKMNISEDNKSTSDKTPRHTEEKMNISEDNKSTSDKTPRHTEEKMNISEDNKSTSDKGDSVDNGGQVKEKSGQNKHKMTEKGPDEKKALKTKKQTHC